MTQFRMPDGSYVINYNGLPYHVTSDNALFEAAVRDALPLFVPPLPTTEEKRAAASLSRTEFVSAVRAAGLLTQAEAVSAAKGDLPPAVVSAIAGAVSAGAMTQDEADGAEILWAGLSTVERNHPLVSIAQTAYDLTDAQVDALFGVGA